MASHPNKKKKERREERQISERCSLINSTQEILYSIEKKVLLKMAMEVEDDVFFADLSKQIALLIMDDDDGGEEFPVQSPPVHVQELGFHHVPQAINMPPPYMYEMACYRRESKGTGVFIPRSSAPRRKNRSGRSSSINNGSQRQLDKSGVAVSRAANNDRLQSNYYKNSGSLKNRT